MSKKNDSLNVTLVQPNVYWENKEKNLAQYDKVLAKIKPTQLVVLPEMFTTGFSMHAAELAETMDGPSVAWMKAKARKLKAAVCGSLIIAEGKKTFNRFVWVMPNGDAYTYDKRHLFSPGSENVHYNAGAEKIIVHYKGWNIAPFVCYDLRFPVWSRNVNNEADVLLYVASWPVARSFAWQQLLIARAIENQCYVIGANRVGKDAQGIDHNGHSVVIDFMGKTLLQGPESKAWAKQVTLQKAPLGDFREKLPFAKDADIFTIKAK